MNRLQCNVTQDRETQCECKTQYIGKAAAWNRGTICGCSLRGTAVYDLHSRRAAALVTGDNADATAVHGLVEMVISGLSGRESLQLIPWTTLDAIIDDVPV